MEWEKGKERVVQDTTHGGARERSAEDIVIPRPTESHPINGVGACKVK